MALQFRNSAAELLEIGERHAADMAVFKRGGFALMPARADRLQPDELAWLAPIVHELEARG